MRRLCFRLLAGLACFIVFQLPLQVHAEVQANAARLGGDGNSTRLVVDLSAPVTADVFVLASPYRVVLDLPGVTFDGSEASSFTGRGLVSAYRFGQMGTGLSRVVIEVTQPVAVTSPEIIEGEDGQPARLVLEMSAVSDEAFRASEAFKRGEAVSRKKAASGDIRGQPGDSRPVIVLDPGHGGIDVGAQAGTGEQEKDIVLAFAQALRARLEQSNRYRVVMTRNDDLFLALGERVEIARRNNAALFISIHADSLSNPFNVSGATVYTLSDRASDREAARLAEKENRSDLIAGVDLSDEPGEVADILLELTQRETKIFSSRFAGDLLKAMRGTMRLNKNPQRSASFRVLRAHDVPSVLLELGYMSNPRDLKLLTSDGWRQKSAGDMLAAIDRFFGDHTVKTTGSVDAPL
jgi:N-acetylmuramoyl-L-alanine amidase